MHVFPQPGRATVAIARTGEKNHIKSVLDSMLCRGELWELIWWRTLQRAASRLVSTRVPA